ncbi:MAG: class I SAM-dependent methyltransferase [Frankiaceae bacterium]
MPDHHFADPRLAQLYDPLDSDRRDLDAYVALAEELGARSVLDIGCGTGTFACMLARRGLDVTAVDPAAASLDIARAKPCAGRVRWLHGDATALPPLQVDLATITGNVAQVFVSDDDGAATLRGARAALRPGGHLVLETRDPAKQAWRGWKRADTYRKEDIAGIGVVETWVNVTEVRASWAAPREASWQPASASASTSAVPRLSAAASGLTVPHHPPRELPAGETPDETARLSCYAGPPARWRISVTTAVLASA